MSDQIFFTDEELMVMIGTINRAMDSQGAILQHTSRTPGNPIRNFKASGAGIVQKFLNEAMRRGILKAPPCWKPPC